MIGKRFAYRERPHTYGQPLRPVEVLKEGPKRSQKVRIRWLDGDYEGLDEWVPKVRLVVPWEEAEAFLDDERRVILAAEASGQVRHTVEWEAVQTVFFSLPKGVDVDLGYRGGERDLVTIDNLDAVCTLLGTSREALLAEPYAFVDRFGEYKAPFPTAVRVAILCCQRFASDVLQYVGKEEEALQTAVATGHYISPHSDDDEACLPSSSAKKWLSEREPVFTLVRQWCGVSAINEFNEILALRMEVERLQELVKSTAHWMREAGHKVKASWLLRELHRSERQRRA